MPRLGLAALALLLFATPAASEETIWLRGSGDDVWIDRVERSEESPKETKTLGRVETSPVPSINRQYSAKPPKRVVHVSVGLGAVGVEVVHVHDFVPRYVYPRYYRDRYYPPYAPYYGSYLPYRGYRHSHHGRHGYRYGRSGRIGSDRVYGEPRTTGHTVRGGAYRR